MSIAKTLDDTELNADELARETSDIIRLWHEPGDGSREERVRSWLFIIRNQMPDSLLGPNCLFQRYSTPHYSEEMVGKYFNRIQEKYQLLQKCQDHLTIILPKALGDWFVRPSPMISARGDIPETIDSGRPDIAKRVWAAFEKEWVGKKNVVHFWEPKKPLTEGAMLVAAESTINILPDVWIYCSPVVTQAFNEKSPNSDARKAVLEGFSELASALLKEKDIRDEKRKVNTKKLEDWISQDDLRVVKISAVGFNPKFGGWRVRSLKRVSRLIEHATCVLDACTAIENNSGAGQSIETESKVGTYEHSRQ